MILVAHERGSKELLPLIRQIGIKAELAHLPFGDFSFSGNGPKGEIYVGIERKTLHDLLNCIDTSRYSAHQKPGMDVLYSIKYLMVEGIFKAHDKGWLMEGNQQGQFWICKPGGRPVLYSKLRRYMFSVGHSGVTVTQTRDMYQTAYDVCELYHYWNKPWEDHTSMLEMPKIVLPSIAGKPRLVRKWAADLDGIGAKLSEEAGRKFKTGAKLAAASVEEWQEIPGVGRVTAERVWKEIREI